MLQPFPADYPAAIRQAQDAVKAALGDGKPLIEVEFPTSSLIGVQGMVRLHCNFQHFPGMACPFDNAVLTVLGGTYDFSKFWLARCCTMLYRERQFPFTQRLFSLDECCLCLALENHIIRTHHFHARVRLIRHWFKQGKWA